MLAALANVGGPDKLRSELLASLKSALARLLRLPGSETSMTGMELS